jgi:hypothetical protein
MNAQSTNTQLVLNPEPFNTPAPHKALTGESLVNDELINETVSHASPLDTRVGSLAPLLDHDLSEHLRTRWNDIQGRFVDEPRSAVQQADTLVSEVVEEITQMFASEHDSLESQWKQGNDVSTEDLRIALQHYRTFFNRLVIQIPT